MSHTTISFFLLLLLRLAFPYAADAQGAASVDVAVYMDSGAWEDGVIAFEHFLDWKGLTHLRVDAARVNASSLSAEFRCLYVPGGYSYDYQKKITTRGEQNIRDLVGSGGAYIGICAGAFFAADHVDWEGGNYPYTLGLFKGTAKGALSEIKPWPEYGMTTITTNPEHPISRNQPRTLNTMYFGGPAFIPDPGFEVDTIATWDAAKQQCAIIAFPYGSGRVLLVGPHPEIEENDARDGTVFGTELTDPESEWGLLWRATDWLLGRPITDTAATSVASAPVPASAVTMGSCRPNPVTDRASLRLTSSAPARAVVSIVDMLGRTVATLFDGQLDAGSRNISFSTSINGQDLPAGRYLVRLFDGGRVQAAPIVILR